MERKHPDAHCENCSLFEIGKFVPSLIPKGQIKLAVVGEAPGVMEAAFREPFKGPSGQLLDQVLEHHGYRRPDVLYTNACLCRPPNNSTPPKDAIAACRPRLIHELELASRTDTGGDTLHDVVALGGTAASVLIDDPRNITRLRVGPPKLPTRALGETSIERVVPTWHPAYCLRNADAFPSFVSDVGKLKGRSVSTWQPPDWKFFEDPGQAIQAIKAVEEIAQELIIDIEAGIEKDTSYGHPNEYDLLCIGIGYATGKVVVIGEQALRDKGVLDALRALFRKIPPGGQNVKFDFGGLYPALGGLTAGFDTMLASYVLDERPGNHGLETLSVERLGSPVWKFEIERHIPKGGNYAGVPRPVLYKYNAWDVHNTWMLKDLFKPLLEEEPPTWEYTNNPWLAHHQPKKPIDLLNFLCKASDQLMYLELNGLPVDRNYSNDLVDDFLDRIRPIEEEMNALVRESTKDLEPEKRKEWINPRSPKQIKEYIASQGITITGTDKDIMAALLEKLRSGSPVRAFVEALLEHRRQQKLYSTYVVGIRKRLYRGRVYTTYLLHGSTSGRLASRNPNLQNIVRDKQIRRQFTVSKPGNIFVQADYKNAEARVITTLAQDEYLRSIFCDPTRNIFNEMSDQIFGKGNWDKEQYIRTKAFFYGIGYGRTPYSIAAEHKMAMPAANRLYRSLTDLIEPVMRWQEGIKAKVSKGEDLVTTFGRRRRFWLITSQNQKDVFNEALSFVPQSTASDICLSALIRLRPMLRGIGFIRLTIHDALVAECPESSQQQVATMLTQVMEEEGSKWTTYVPFAVDTSVGKSWGDL